MSIGTFAYPMPANEPVLNHAPGSAEKKRLKEVVAISSLAIDLAISLIQSDDGKQSDKISGDAEESKSKKSKKTKKSVEGK